jgi:lysophospholipase L1-like esterase
MGVQLIDDNGVSLFIDDTGANPFVDDLGNFTGTSGSSVAVVPLRLRLFNTMPSGTFSATGSSAANFLSDLPAYDGLVATRGMAPSGKRSETQAMARSAHYTRSAVTQMKIITANWSGPETASGATATVTASIEYPAGTFTQLKWSGATSATISNGGQVTSDYASVTVPTNTQFWIRQYLTCSAGTVCCVYQGNQTSIGDALVLGTSGVADQTMSGTVTDGGYFICVAPLAIIAPIKAPSICILGDSISIGVNNVFVPNSTGDAGAIAPSIAPSFGYSGLGCNGDEATNFVSAHTNRVAVLQYCSHIIVEYGTNDLYVAGRTVGQLQTDLATIYGYAPSGQVVFQTTLIPRTNSTDSWSTTANQTTVGVAPVAAESLRVAFNDAVRAGTFGPNGGFFDPTTVIETSLDSGIWKAGVGSAPCATQWTADGVHPNPCAYYTALQGSGFIDLSRIHRP